jgi:hypothetical protein
MNFVSVIEEAAMSAGCDEDKGLTPSEVIIPKILGYAEAVGSDGIAVAYLVGSLHNGAERDQGKRYHALTGGGVALCGAKPGRFSGGWSYQPRGSQQVTCPRCLKMSSA